MHFVNSLVYICSMLYLVESKKDLWGFKPFKCHLFAFSLNGPFYVLIGLIIGSELWIITYKGTVFFVLIPSVLRQCSLLLNYKA